MIIVPRALWLAVISSLLLIISISAAATTKDEEQTGAEHRPAHSYSFLTRFFPVPIAIPKPHVNLLPLASLFGLTTRPLGVVSMQQGEGEGEGVDGSVSNPSTAAATYTTRRGREELTLLTFNVRYDNPLARRTPSIPSPDSDTTFPTRTYGEVSWSTRRHFIADTILLHNPDVFIFQEVLHNQLQDLVYLLGDDYAYVGVGRNDGDQKGEAVPVFWRRDRLRLRSERQGGVGEEGWTHFWLSETPDVVGSVGWDADQTRMCTHVALEFIPTTTTSSSSSSTTTDDGASQNNAGSESRSVPIHIFSTHYDHLGHVARSKSSELILQRANDTRTQVKKTFKDDTAEPLILLGGDLNSPRHESGWENLVRGHHGIPSGDDHNGDNNHSLSFIDLQLALPTRFGLPFPSDHFRQTQDAHGDDHQHHHHQKQKPFQAPPPTARVANEHPHQRGILSTLYGPAASFTDWNPGPRTRPTSEDRIDFWFMGDNVHHRHHGKSASASPSWKIKTAGTLSNWNLLEGGWRGSDHRPVIVRLRWE